MFSIRKGDKLPGQAGKGYPSHIAEIQDGR